MLISPCNIYNPCSPIIYSDNEFGFVCVCVCVLSFHYENTPIQIHCKFYRGKYENIKMKNCDILLIFAQNIDCGYSLELPQ